jgi:Fic family protein
MPRRVAPADRKPRPERTGITELREFFALNPAGEISIAQAAAKLDVSPRTAMDYLGQLLGEGMLERVSKYSLKRE